MKKQYIEPGIRCLVMKQPLLQDLSTHDEVGGTQLSKETRNTSNSERSSWGSSSRSSIWEEEEE